MARQHYKKCLSFASRHEVLESFTTVMEMRCNFPTVKEGLRHLSPETQQPFFSLSVFGSLNSSLLWRFPCKMPFRSNSFFGRRPIALQFTFPSKNKVPNPRIPRHLSIGTWGPVLRIRHCAHLPIAKSLASQFWEMWTWCKFHGLALQPALAKTNLSKMGLLPFFPPNFVIEKYLWSLEKSIN